MRLSQLQKLKVPHPGVFLPAGVPAALCKLAFVMKRLAAVWGTESLPVRKFQSLKKPAPAFTGDGPHTNSNQSGCAA